MCSFEFLMIDYSKEETKFLLDKLIKTLSSTV